MTDRAEPKPRCCNSLLRLILIKQTGENNDNNSSNNKNEDNICSVERESKNLLAWFHWSPLTYSAYVGRGSFAWVSVCLWLEGLGRPCCSAWLRPWMFLECWDGSFDKMFHSRSVTFAMQACWVCLGDSTHALWRKREGFSLCGLQSTAEERRVTKQ